MIQDCQQDHSSNSGIKTEHKIAPPGGSLFSFLWNFKRGMTVLAYQCPRFNIFQTIRTFGYFTFGNLHGILSLQSIERRNKKTQNPHRRCTPRDTRGQHGRDLLKHFRSAVFGHRIRQPPLCHQGPWGAPVRPSFKGWRKRKEGPQEVPGRSP